MLLVANIYGDVLLDGLYEMITHFI